LALGRCPSTISREIRRHSGKTTRWDGGYDPLRAHHRARRWRKRRGGRFKLARQPDLATWIKDGLTMGWSCEQLAGRLTLTYGKPLISHESIYRYIYHRAWLKDYSWHRLLPGRRKARRLRRQRQPRNTDRTSIHDRPAEAGPRSRIGDWEADLMCFSQQDQPVLILHERATRMTLATPVPKQDSETVMAAILSMTSVLPQEWCKTITFDNGAENADHHRLAKRFPEGAFFCDPHKPWQKGSVENTIGRLRRYLHRKTPAQHRQKEQVDAAIDRLNNTPRKCLGFYAPSEVVCALIQLLHLCRESTGSG
jgi:IS30 family transposase